MEKSTSIKELAKALHGFHKEMGKIAKTSQNPFFKSKYADLPSILDAIEKPLENAGLVFVSIPDGDGLTSLLIHSESGEYISANAIMKPVKSDPQSIGSAITYQRRYSIGSVLNLNIDIDDDGNKASEPVKPKAEKPETNFEQPKQDLPKFTVVSPNYDSSVKWFAENANSDLEKLQIMRTKMTIAFDVEKQFLNDVAAYKINHNIQ